MEMRTTFIGNPECSRDYQSYISPIMTTESKNTPNTDIPIDPTTVIRQTTRKSNEIGIAGFVLSLFWWAPFIGWLAWLLGLIFSIMGMFRRPRGLAIAGFILSLIGLILMILLIAIIGR